MNPLLNPILLSKLAWNYFSIMGRIWKLNKDEMKRYQEKMFLKVLRYAYHKTIFYRKKYDAAGVDIEKIRGLEDSKNLPLVSKEELASKSLEEILPRKYRDKMGYKVSTSGSSGKPIILFFPLYESTINSIYGLRILKAYGLNWRKARVSNIGDFSIPGSSDEEIYRDLAEKAMSMKLLGEHQMLSVNESGEILIKRLSEFKPDVIIGYTSVLVNLAFLRKEGLGEDIRPKYIISSGEILDKYSRKLIEDAFDAEVKNLYASTEGAITAFECLEGKMHVNADLIYLETVDEEGNVVEEGKIGNAVITKLLPVGVPIIRYSGLADMVSLSDEDCECGINTPIIKSLEGRKRESIVLPDRRVIPPASAPLPLIESLEKFNVTNLERFQFYQEKMDRVEIRLKFRGETREKEKLLKDIEEGYRKLFGKGIRVEVKEVEKIENPSGPSLPPMVISRVKLE